VNVTELLITIDSVPAPGFVPDQFPDALQLSASVDDQLNVIVPPRLTVGGLALRVRVGALTAGGALTVTVTLALSLPPALNVCSPFPRG